MIYVIWGVHDSFNPYSDFDMQVCLKDIFYNQTAVCTNTQINGCLQTLLIFRITQYISIIYINSNDINHSFVALHVHLNIHFQHISQNCDQTEGGHVWMLLQS